MLSANCAVYIVIHTFSARQTVSLRWAERDFSVFSCAIFGWEISQFTHFSLFPFSTSSDSEPWKYFFSNPHFRKNKLANQSIFCFVTARFVRIIEFRKTLFGPEWLDQQQKKYFRKISIENCSSSANSWSRFCGLQPPDTELTKWTNWKTVEALNHLWLNFLAPQNEEPTEEIN